MGRDDRDRGRKRDRSRERSWERSRDRRDRKGGRSRDRSTDSSRSDESDGERERRRRLAGKITNKLLAHQDKDTAADGPRKRFVWAKKIEKDIVEHGRGVDDYKADAERRRMEERMREIEKVKELRAQRERERQEREAEKELLNREKAHAEALELDRKEELFHLTNAIRRSEVTLRPSRHPPSFQPRTLPIVDPIHRFRVIPRPHPLSCASDASSARVTSSQ